MLDIQEADQSTADLGNNPEDPNTILENLRARVPAIHELTENPERLEEERTTAVNVKLKDILQDYSDSPEKTVVSNLLSKTVAAGCVAYGIDPVELIVVPREIQQGENHIAMAGRKKSGSMDIKQLFIDPSEIMFRVQLLSQHGETTAKNVTDLMFVLMHEMVHLGQAIYAEDDLKKSKQFTYADQPTELHADEVALAYSKNLEILLKGRSEDNLENRILRQGLPQTIKDATANRRPSM